MSITDEIVKRQDRIIKNQKDIINFQREIIKLQGQQFDKLKRQYKELGVIINVDTKI